MQTTDTHTARIVNVYVYDHGDGLLVAGEVDIDSDKSMLMKMPGRVDVEVTGEDGTVIASYQPDSYKNLHDHYVTYSRFVFSAVLPAVPGPRQSIHLIYRPSGAPKMKM